MADLIKLYKEHIDPDITPYDIHQLYSSFNLTLWVKHWDPEQQRVQEKFLRERHALVEKWILENSKLKPRIKMDARKARQKAVEINQSRRTAQTQELIQWIDKYANDGKYEVTWHGLMLPESKTYLESLGYRIDYVEESDPRDQSIGNGSYTIKW